MPFILVRKNKSPFSDLKLKSGQEFKGGRSLSCDIVMDKAQGVSRQHFRIFEQEGQWTLELISKFGIITHQGKSVEKLELKDGIIFSVPPFEFEFSMELRSDIIEIDFDAMGSLVSSQILDKSKTNIQSGKEKSLILESSLNSGGESELQNKSSSHEAMTPSLGKDKDSQNEGGVHQSGKINLFDEASEVKPNPLNLEVSKVTQQVEELDDDQEITENKELEESMLYKFLRGYVKIFPTKFKDGELLRLEGKEWTVGRSKESKIRFKTNEISRRHFDIRKDDDDYYIYDLGSVNGSFLNKKRLPSLELIKLKTGDLIEIGSIKMKYFLHDYRREKELFLLQPSRKAQLGDQSENGAVAPELSEVNIGGRSTRTQVQSAEADKLNSISASRSNDSQIKKTEAWGDVDLALGESSFGGAVRASDENLGNQQESRDHAGPGYLKNKKKSFDINKIFGTMLLALAVLFTVSNYSELFPKRDIALIGIPLFSDLNPSEKRAVNLLMKDAREAFLKGNYGKCLDKINVIESAAQNVSGVSEIKDQCAKNLQ